MPTYAARPEDLDQVERLAAEHPMAKDLRDQIAAWIEPHTENTYLEHRDAMTCVEIAYPLIAAYIADRERGADSDTSGNDSGDEFTMHLHIDNEEERTREAALSFLPDRPDLWHTVESLGRRSAARQRQAQRALDLLATYGHTDGAHHKAWLVDQVARLLTGDGYEAWVGPLRASWDTGIAP